MVKKRMLLRDFITRLAQADPQEIYVEVEETEQDVFVLPLSFPFGVPDSTGILNRFVERSGVRPVVLEIVDIDGTIGTAVVTPGSPGEIWELRSVTILSAAGGNYGVTDDTVLITAVNAVAAAATGELIEVPVPVEGGSAIGISSGLAPDTWNIRAVRIL